MCIFFFFHCLSWPASISAATCGARGLTLNLEIIKYIVVVDVVAETLVFIFSISLISQGSRICFVIFPSLHFSFSLSFFVEKTTAFLCSNWLYFLHLELIYLYRDIERTANQNTRKQLYTRRYYTQHYHRTLRVGLFIYLFVYLFSQVVMVKLLVN